jgi:hypothetical protein
MQEQLSLICGTRASHDERQKTRAQCVVVAISSFAYLLPAFSFLAEDNPVRKVFGFTLFLFITVSSAVADGSFFDFPWWERQPGHWGPLWARRVDRCLATTGGIFGMIQPLIDSFLLTVLVLVVITLPLYIARRTPLNAPWTWVTAQSVWHILSGAVLAFLAPKGWYP